MSTDDVKSKSSLSPLNEAYWQGFIDGTNRAIEDFGPLRPAPAEIRRAQKRTVLRRLEMAFDAKKFVADASVPPMSTQFLACPEGTYTATISDDGDIDDWFREVEWKDKKTGEPRSAAAVRIPFLVTDSGVKAQLGRDSIIVPYDVFLDVTGDGKLDTSEGKNVRIGQLREALGQNNSNWGWSMLRGAGPVMIKVSQRSDPKDPQIKYAQVDRVAKVA